MSFFKPATKVIFIDDDLEKAFNCLREDAPLRKAITRVINKLKFNIFAGENISKELIPNDYIKKYKIDNLWWCPLPDGWRLVYSIMVPNKIDILAVIIDYYSHKDYERKFGY